MLWFEKLNQIFEPKIDKSDFLDRSYKLFHFEKKQSYLHFKKKAYFTVSYLREQRKTFFFSNL